MSLCDFKRKLNSVSETHFNLLRSPASHSLFKKTHPFMKNQSSLTLFLATVPVSATQFNQAFLQRPQGQSVLFYSFCTIYFK